MSVARPPRERFMAKVIPTPSGCWLWKGAHDVDGYAQFHMPNRSKMRAARAAYELFVGPIPKGLQIDHLCCVRGCVSPDHLEPVTPRENVMRGATITAANAAKTHCKYGHPFDDENTYRRPDGDRDCRTCRRRHSEKHR